MAKYIVGNLYKLMYARPCTVCSINNRLVKVLRNGVNMTDVVGLQDLKCNAHAPKGVDFSTVCKLIPASIRLK